jgi:hypothetical protein
LKQKSDKTLAFNHFMRGAEHKINLEAKAPDSNIRSLKSSNFGTLTDRKYFLLANIYWSKPRKGRLKNLQESNDYKRLIAHNR